MRIGFRADGQEFAGQPAPKAHTNGDASQANPSAALIAHRH
jgi:hypothetical protein